MAKHESLNADYSKMIEEVIEATPTLDDIGYSLNAIAAPNGQGGMALAWLVVLTTKGVLLGSTHMASAIIADFTPAEAAFKGSIAEIIGELAQARQAELTAPAGSGLII